MASLMIFWKDGECVEINPENEDEVYLLLDERELHDCFCVDFRYNGNSRERYGSYEGMGVSMCWVSCWFSELPPKFQLALLLLGVTYD